MRLRYLFIFLTVVTIFLIFLYFLGHEILDLIMAMITVQFLSLGAMIEHQRKFPSKTIKSLSERVDKIEKICSDIHNVLDSNPELDKKLEKQKNGMSQILDDIVEKSTKLDKKLNGFLESENEKNSSISDIIYLDEEEQA